MHHLHLQCFFIYYHTYRFTILLLGRRGIFNSLLNSCHTSTLSCLLSTVTSVWQVNISEDYLECVAKQQETLRPFGDVPRDMKMKVIRAFVTARSFIQGLVVSGDVVRKVSQVSVYVCVHVTLEGMQWDTQRDMMSWCERSWDWELKICCLCQSERE